MGEVLLAKLKHEGGTKDTGTWYEVWLDGDDNRILAKTDLGPEEENVFDKGNRGSLMSAIGLGKRILTSKVDEGWAVEFEDWKGATTKIYSDELESSGLKEKAAQVGPDGKEKKARTKKPAPPPEPILMTLTDFFRMSPPELAKHAKQDVRNLVPISKKPALGLG